MDVIAALSAHSQATDRVQPGHCSLDDPSVLTKTPLAVALSAGDARRDAPLPEQLAASLKGIAPMLKYNTTRIRVNQLSDVCCPERRY